MTSRANAKSSPRYRLSTPSIGSTASPAGNVHWSIQEPKSRCLSHSVSGLFASRHGAKCDALGYLVRVYVRRGYISKRLQRRCRSVDDLWLLSHRFRPHHNPRPGSMAADHKQAIWQRHHQQDQHRGEPQPPVDGRGARTPDKCGRGHADISPLATIQDTGKWQRASRRGRSSSCPIISTSSLVRPQ